MKLAVSRAEVWSAALEDRAGGLSEKLSPLAKAGVNLEFVIARRTPEYNGKGIVFLAPIRGAKQTRAAKAAGVERSPGLHALRVEGTDRPGLAAHVAAALARENISMRGVWATAVGRRFVGYVALDDADDAPRATRVLKKLR